MVSNVFRSNAAREAVTNSIAQNCVADRESNLDCAPINDAEKQTA